MTITSNTTSQTNGHATPVEDTPPQPIAAAGSPPREPPEPPDPFDPARLALGQDFGDELGVKKLVTQVPVRKPHRHEWVRAHPDADYRLQTAALPFKAEREELHLVAPALWRELPGDLRRIELFVAINREGVVFLWPVKLPGADGRLDTWNASLIDAINYARQRWVRVAANMALGGYEVFTPTGDLPDPDWPATPMRELLRTAFRDHFIDSLDHPILKRLRGEV